MPGSLAGSSFLLADANDGTHASLADVLVHSGPCPVADARAVLASDFDRLPGLTVVAVACSPGRCLVGDRTGDVIVLPCVSAELAGAGAYLWLLAGRRLGLLRMVAPRGQGIQPGTGPLYPQTAGRAAQVECFDQLGTGGTEITLELSDLGERHQYIGLIGGRT